MQLSPLPALCCELHCSGCQAHDLLIVVAAAVCVLSLMQCNTRDTLCGIPLITISLITFVCFLPYAVGFKGLELLVQNLSRLDESNEEDAKGVNTTMGVLENLLEVCSFLLSFAFE